MKRADRLLAIVLELQAGGRRSAARLAAEFGVSERTIYRDVAALNEAGVPIVSAPGQGYWLMEGYFLPPLQFSRDEATLLLLGSEVMAQSFDDQYRAAVMAAARKIEAVLPDAARSDVRFLRDSVRILETEGGDSPALLERLRALRGALLERRTVTFCYTKRADRQAQWRRVDPHHLFRVNGVWMLSGYCHDRRAFRTFRLSRMAELAVTAASFARRVEGPPRQTRDDRPLEAMVRLSPAAAPWLEENRSYHLVAERLLPGGGLELRLRARSWDDLLPWLRRWGPDLEVLAPPELRRRMQRDAAAVAEQHGVRLEPSKA